MAGARYRFHCTIHAGHPTQGVPFPVSFEQAAEALARLPQMYFEPDGSFVQVSDPDGRSTWQVDGVLYDRADRLLYVDLKGECPSWAFDKLLEALGWPIAGAVFQLTREAVLLDEEQFRRHATMHSS